MRPLQPHQTSLILWLIQIAHMTQMMQHQSAHTGQMQSSPFPEDIHIKIPYGEPTDSAKSQRPSN